MFLTTGSGHDLVHKEDGMVDNFKPSDDDSSAGNGLAFEREAA
jgi:hypothetical protein